MVKIIISENQGDQRLDRFLKKYLGNASLSYIYKLIRKDLKVNGKRAKEDTVINAGDELVFYMLDSEFQSLQKEKKIVKAKKQFKAIYEDENILIAYKPFGLLTHGDKSEKKNHLTNQVIDYLIEKSEYDPRIDKTFTPAPVNRLDRNTTGLVLFGKNAAALKELSYMIRERGYIKKTYLTIVNGKIPSVLELNDKMIKNERSNTVKVISSDSDDGKTMMTIARPIKYGQKASKWYTLVEVEIVTGRTHQIRAQLANAGYPLIGDVKYGHKDLGQTTQLLHSYMLEFSKCPDGKLSYLEGKIVKANPTDDFMTIQNQIFEKR